MKVIDAIIGSNPGGGGASSPCVPVPGSTFQVRNFSPAYKAKILSLFAVTLTSGKLQIVSPYFHDISPGLEFTLDSNTASNLFPTGICQYVESGDQLLFNSLSNVNAIVFALSLYYEQLPEVDTQFINYQELKKRAVKFKVLRMSFPNPSTQLVWKSQTPANDGTFKQDKQYAFLGAQSIGGRNLLRLRSKDLGNMNIVFPTGGSGSVNDQTWNYFENLSKLHDGIDVIPVLNGINIPTATADIIGFSSFDGEFFFAELK
jgi:hypothetical protein